MSDKVFVPHATDKVLEILLTVSPVFTGQTRPNHPKGWVSALHVLSETYVGEPIQLVQTGSPHHSAYHAVADAVLNLESIGLVRVQRACGHQSNRANPVEKIWLADT